MGDITANFSRAEFACKCCGLADPHPRLVLGLEAMRARLGGLPLTVSSGTRCAAYNARVGGAPQSQHVPQAGYGGYSLAADIQCPAATLEELLNAAIDVPDFHNGGIGLYVKGAVRWIHVDVRNGRARWGEIDGKRAEQLAVMDEDDRRRAAGSKEATA
ncbi:MAG TPA: D-Ala-D-Ala carboxypeptidase family metallohydrolase [Candidatus Krumholzibacteria bacterium]|nr:D-Ala-D-Ala carboxypeptidase family metallohydrolase [Candidatus Krumholzibacteria bacterium]HPD73640.1 D-Ala-D-Ala carboxypeptidase family metallohydrolase [Candidatus Krumholzibacteria bacterium]HRY42225.1 D-Ala-D-Ala carboxypeptidase family metallohydrolase [Candidatus Krumholzibacteria bacterium]